MKICSSESMFRFQNILLLVVCSIMFVTGCSKSEDDSSDIVIIDDEEEEEEENQLSYADIDFSNWKVTLPVDENNNGKPDEYQPDQLLDFGYQSLTPVQPFMYDDTADESLVFYTYPDVTTPNSSYSRTELRELINPSNSKDNWTLEEGGIMRGRLKVESISEDTGSSSEFHRVIVMQIHGIISEEDMAIHGFSSNNGPPLLKMYWKDGFLWAHKKSLVNESTSGDDLLDTSGDTWEDIKHNFGYVGFEAFNFKIIASNGRLELQLNEEAPYVYEDISLDKWPFENYFKAGNYLLSTDALAYSYIKYYNLYVTH